MENNPFSDAEIATRIEKVRAVIAGRGLEAAIFASAENVFWLTGLDHWGYFAPHLLILPVEGAPVLVARAMERIWRSRSVRRSFAATRTARRRPRWPPAC